MCASRVTRLGLEVPETDRGVCAAGEEETAGRVIDGQTVRTGLVCYAANFYRCFRRSESA